MGVELRKGKKRLGFERSETKKALLVDKKNIKKKVKSKTTQPTIKRKQLKKIAMGVELRKGKKRLVNMKKYSKQAKTNGKIKIRKLKASGQTSAVKKAKKKLLEHQTRLRKQKK